METHLRIAKKQGMPWIELRKKSSVFHPEVQTLIYQVMRKLGNDAIGQNIEHKIFNEFSKKSKNNSGKYFFTRKIDRTIESMDKGIGMITKFKGQRTKY